MQIRPENVTLAQLGLNDEGPLALIDAAATAGFRGLGLPLRSGALRNLKFEIVGNRQLVRQIRRAADAAGVIIFDTESLVLGHEPEKDALKATFETAAELGASRMSCLGYEPAIGPGCMQPGEEPEHLARICALAAEFGLLIGVEFMLFRSIRTMQAARKIILQSEAPNVRIILDALHCHRSGLTPEALAALEPDLISHLQLCDAAKKRPDADRLVDEARAERLMPGEGVIPLRQMLRALPRDIPLSLEIPVGSIRHLAVAERARRGAESLAHLSI
ncbi:MAG: sugar phosphate isomerase/epimerase family protein [Pseudorhodobacter sp.]